MICARIVDRFWSKVSKGQGCWEWQASTKPNGYGQFGVAAGNIVLAHRFSWLLAHGEIPIGLCVLHRCDNRRCVRPNHLFLGTLADNNLDTHQKGRAVHPWGEQAGSAKLTALQVGEIRRLYVLESHTIRSLAKRYAVHHRTIHRIVSGEHWRHLNP